MKQLCVLAALFLQATVSLCQNVSVIGAASGNGSYPTLAEALAAINSAAQDNAVIRVKVEQNTTEPATGAVLDAGTWASLTINPDGARTVSGSVNAGLPLLDLNGADRVTIDGINSNGHSLTLVNTTAAANSGTCTIRFIGGATNNLLTHCTILGSFSAAVGTNGGIIYFATDAVTGNGNDTNSIISCRFGPAGTNLPSKCIYGNGSTSSLAAANSGMMITGNEFFDYFGNTVSSAGIYVAGGCTDWRISNNKFYQTGPHAQTSGAQHSAIWISNTSSGSGYVVAGNTIGYASPLGTGSYSISGVSGSSFVPIYINVAAANASMVNDNTITAISFTGVLSGTGASAPLRGIHIAAGLVEVGTGGSNHIGSMTSTGNILFSTSATGTAEVCGIYQGGTAGSMISGNSIGGITCSTTSTGAVNFYGIRVNTGAAVSLQCNYNIIGGNLPHSIESLSTANGCLVRGIQVDAASSSIESNVISNLAASGGTGNGSGASASVIGIHINAPSSVHNVRWNRVQFLSNSSSSATSITGIYYNGAAGGGGLSANFLHSFSIASTLATAQVNGIVMAGGSANCNNNMISLGFDGDGGALTHGNQLSGIQETGGNHRFYFNSIFIGGTGVEGSGNSYAFQSNLTSGSRDYRNNIFCNKRTNGTGTGKHYALKLGSGNGILSDHNIFRTENGGILGIWDGTEQAGLAGWRAATGQDNDSYFADPPFIQPGGGTGTVNLHLDILQPTVAESGGEVLAEVPGDFDNQVRDLVHPDIGADEINGIIASTLPIELTSFDAEPKGGYVLLKWTTVLEVNAYGFRLERSIDGRLFYPIGFMPSVNDNSEKLISYSYQDTFRTTVRTWYRLLLIDLDGSARPGPTVWVEPAIENSLIFDIYPNPVHRYGDLHFYSGQKEGVEISITGMQGNLVFLKQVKAEIGWNNLDMKLPALKAGLYVLQLKSIRTGKKRTEKILVQ